MLFTNKSKRVEPRDMIPAFLKVLVGEGYTLVGDVYASGPGKLGSRIRGRVDSSSTIAITAGGHVEGSVRADSCRVEGRVDQGISATGALIICANGFVRGDCKASAVELEEGCDFEGALLVGVEDRRHGKNKT